MFNSTKSFYISTVFVVGFFFVLSFCEVWMCKTKKSSSNILLLATKSNQHRQRYTRQLNIPIIFHKQHFYSDIYTKWLIIGLYPGLRRKLREREKKIREKLGVVCICIGLSCCGCFVFFLCNHWPELMNLN